MTVLCCSTYELGHQPLGLAALAGAVAASGRPVRVVDLSVEEWSDALLDGVDRAVFSVPMHTATELALEAAQRCRALRPGLPLAFCGLYAPVLAGHRLLGPGDLLAAGEIAGPLQRWCAGEEMGAGPIVDLGPARPGPVAPPDRHLLPPLERYATYLDRGARRQSAAVESSRGCNHSCGHCPVAAVYRGRSRPVALESVVADLDQVVEAGAGHVSFADPDFLNRPRHALAVAQHLHARHPSLTFDATVKVEHLLAHRDLLADLARFGCTYVVSAFESTDDAVLGLLDKGHTAADEAEAVASVRRAGIELRPSWLPFSPWTTRRSLADLLAFTARADLVGSTDPVQFSIRLLLPHGSLLLEAPDETLTAALGRAGTDGEWHASRPWAHADPAIDELQGALASLVEEVGDADPHRCFAAVWALGITAGLPLAAEPPPVDPALASPWPAGDRPRSSEAWFCCAEPTRAQLELVRR